MSIVGFLFVLRPYRQLHQIANPHGKRPHIGAILAFNHA